ncbi:MAG: DUF1631 family protein [Proteobacteria bacterium]|nr:DUF1631 family protein [Pseudomonadota bacterium]
MMDQNTLNAALIAHFPLPDTDKPEIGIDILLEHLRVMQTSGVSEPSILLELQKKDPKSSLSADHYALIQLIDSCCSSEVTKAEFPAEVSNRLMGVVACATRIALNEGIESLSQDHNALYILESLIDLSIGWPDIRGNPRELVEQKFNSSLLGLTLITDTLGSDDAIEGARNNLLTLLQEDIINFSRNERQRIDKLEQRMVDAEAGQFKTVQAKNLAAKTLNAAMENRTLSKPIVEFLQGAWLESLQLILTREGLQSDQWLKATKLTETLIMTMQPGTSDQTQNAKLVSGHSPSTDADVEIEKGVEAFPRKDADSAKEPATPAAATIATQDLYRIIEHLPEELRGSLVALEHNSTAADEALAAIESAHIDVMKGEPSPAYEFQLITTDEGLLDESTSVSQSLLAPVEKLVPGQWFVYSEESQSPRHIKLTLKVNELKQLLFTNRSGAKVLQVNFDEFAYLMSTKTATALPQLGAITQSLRLTLTNLVNRQVKKEKVVEAKIKKRAAAKRKKEMEETQFVLVAVRKDQLQSDDTAEEREKALQLVAQLNLGATLRMNGVGNETVEAKLAVDDPLDNKIIFVDKTGLNLGEYTKEEIADLIAGGQCEVVDSGLEEKDNFRRVIARLRKKKSLSENTE